MYNDLKVRITHGAFSLLDMQRRIKKIYALGELSEDQMDELLSLAAEKASPESERPKTLALIQTLSDKLDELTARLNALENTDSNSEIAEYPVWEPWDGLNNKYQPGTVVSHNGQLWQSTYSGQNVWEPGAVDDRFWTQYEPVA